MKGMIHIIHHFIGHSSLLCVCVVVLAGAVVREGAGGVAGQSDTRLVRLNDFLFTSNMDNINIFKVSVIHPPNHSMYS